MNCLFCKNEATYKVTGWVEVGFDDGFVYHPVCDEHVKSYQEWNNEEDIEPDGRIHELEYLTGIKKVTQDTVWE